MHFEQYENRMMRQRKIRAFFLSAVLMGVLILSAVFVMHEAEHECSGEHCPICGMIARCEEHAYRIGTALPAAAAAAVMTVFVLTKEKLCVTVPFAAVNTPVLEKIRMNN